MAQVMEKQAVRDQTVKEIMHQGCLTIRSDATLTDAIRKMNDAGVSSLLVEPRWDGDAYGIVSRRDVLDEAFVPGPRRFNFSERQVFEVMTKPFIAVSSGLKVKYAARLMKRYGVHHLPVHEGARMVGMLSDQDIFSRILPR